MNTLKRISAAELSNHSHEGNAWIALNGVVWDFTGFAAKHPGGHQIIEEHFGKDGSARYNEIHSPGLVASHFGAEKKIGVITDLPQTGAIQTNKDPIPPKPDLNSIISLAQFKQVARTVFQPKAWAYVAGATEDGITNDLNADYFRRILFRPQVLNGALNIKTKTVFLEREYDFPVFIAPTSSVKLSHPDGEVALAKASVARGVPVIVPTMSSYSLAEIVGAVPPGYPFFLQLYVSSDRSQTEQFLSEGRALGALGVFVTVDLPVLSKRELHEAQEQPHQTQDPEKTDEKPLAGRVAPPPVNVSVDANLRWADIEWIRKTTQLPVIPKGIQTAADAKRAFDLGCAGIHLSNHGGRALDTAPPAILVLLEIHATCPEILEQMEVIIDGGIQRGSDILKAICLGASAVCVGRSFLYSLSYGEEGVKRAFDILREEVEIGMALLGINSLDQAHPGLLNTSNLDWMVYPSDKHPWARRVVRRQLKL